MASAIRLRIGRRLHAPTLISLRRLKQEHLPDVSERWLYDLARRGEIPAVRLGTRWLFDPEQVLAALKGGKTKSPDSEHGGR